MHMLLKNQGIHDANQPLCLDLPDSGIAGYMKLNLKTL
jgi:hypothetical protein